MSRVERSKSKVSRRLSFYIHIPYCLQRCGYCDFNTYTPSELKGPDLATVSQSYIDSALKEIEIAAENLGGSVVPSVFFGGGTPSLMPANELARVLEAIRQRFTLTDDVEITIEVNPDSVTSEFLSKMRESGANRISMGMQSSVPHVLKVLDRTHNPENVSVAVAKARTAGFENISVDLIYGAPNESFSDWQSSVAAALCLEINHISAYALIVEKGTKLAAQVARGELKMPPDDETAEKYLYADNQFKQAGFEWYELSNWSKPNASCRHNQAYWDGSMWWGIGPGAHSFVDNQRWWNVKHPVSYQQKILAGESVVQEQETLTSENQADEFLMLQIRTRSGIPHSKLSVSQVDEAVKYLETGHLDAASWQQGSLVLTQSGRLIADRIVRSLVV